MENTRYVNIETSEGPRKVVCLGEFRYEIGNRAVLFKVTVSTTPVSPLVVTHSASGRIFAQLFWKDIVKTRFNRGRNNYPGAGAKVVTYRIKEVGLQKVITALKGYPDE